MFYQWVLQIRTDSSCGNCKTILKGSSVVDPLEAEGCQFSDQFSSVKLNVGGLFSPPSSWNCCQWGFILQLLIQWKKRERGGVHCFPITPQIREQIMPCAKILYSLIFSLLSYLDIFLDSWFRPLHSSNSIKVAAFKHLKVQQSIPCLILEMYANI